VEEEFGESLETVEIVSKGALEEGFGGAGNGRVAHVRSKARSETSQLRLKGRLDEAVLEFGQDSLQTEERSRSYLVRLTAGVVEDDEPVRALLVLLTVLELVGDGRLPGLA
jgi:hypothetical protein